jgi:hypothetical protein
MRSRSERSRGRSVTSLTGCVGTAGAYRGRRNFGATSRFTALSLSFDILLTIAMNGGHQTIASSRIFHFVFVAAKRKLFSPPNRHADGAAAKARWTPSRRKNTSQRCDRRQDRFKFATSPRPGQPITNPNRQDYGKLVFYVCWLNQLDDVTFRHGISLLSTEKWRRQALPRYAAFPIPAVVDFGR